MRAIFLLMALGFSACKPAPAPLRARSSQATQTPAPSSVLQDLQKQNAASGALQKPLSAKDQAAIAVCTAQLTQRYPDPSYAATIKLQCEAATATKNASDQTGGEGPQVSPQNAGASGQGSSGNSKASPDTSDQYGDNFGNEGTTGASGSGNEVNVDGKPAAAPAKSGGGIVNGVVGAAGSVVGGVADAAGSVIGSIFGLFSPAEEKSKEDKEEKPKETPAP